MNYPYTGGLRLPHACEDMVREVVDPSSCVWFLPWAREYLVERLGCGLVPLLHCPYCGATLPGSLRHEYWRRTSAGTSPGWDVEGDAWWLAAPDLAGPVTTVAVEGPVHVQHGFDGDEDVLVVRLPGPPSGCARPGGTYGAVPVGDAWGARFELLGSRDVGVQGSPRPAAPADPADRPGPVRRWVPRVELVSPPVEPWQTRPRVWESAGPEGAGA